MANNFKLTAINLTSWVLKNIKHLEYNVASDPEIFDLMEKLVDKIEEWKENQLNEQKLFKDINWNDPKFNALVSSCNPIKPLIDQAVAYSMHQALDQDDAGWDMVKGWFEHDDDDPTVETPLPEDYCKKCKSKMRLLNTGLRKKIYACPKCEKV